MAKRSAANDLNHDNWDAADEKEDPGQFKAASGTELKNRVIRKAKRSLNTSATSTSAASSPFAKFSGFTTNTASSPFFSAVNKTSSPFSAAASKTENSSNSPFPAIPENPTNQNSLPSFFSATKKIKEETPNGNTTEETKKFQAESAIQSPQNSASGESTKTKQSRGVEYCKQLKSLNESVFKWMQKHMDKNAVSDFTPVFNDYKKHLDSLNNKYPVRKVETVTSQQGGDFFKKTLSSDDNSNSTEQPKFKVENKKPKDETDYGAHFSSNTTNTSTFSFGINKTPTATSSNSPLYPNSSAKEEATKNNKEETKPFGAGFFGQGNKEESKGATTQFSAGFSFGQNNKEDGKGTGFGAGFFSKPFQAGGDKPFSFATAPVEKSAEGGEEEYVPPKNDFVAVSEEGAVYSKRCKLFFKKDDSFADKGVGTLYVKTLDDTTQLLVRADTNLGNILLNIRLSASLPISRSGKNNVLIACIPNPPVDPKNPDKAIPMLIRVKTSEDADELLETLNKYKS